MKFPPARLVVKLAATQQRSAPHSTGTYFWVDPAERLVVVFMAHAPGVIRYYHRQLLHALVLQALD